MKKKKGKTVYQEHHPDKEAMPNYTITLRRFHHYFISRLDNFKSNSSNLKELYNVKKAVSFIIKRMLKELNKNVNCNSKLKENVKAKRKRFKE